MKRSGRGKNANGRVASRHLYNSYSQPPCPSRQRISYNLLSRRPCTFTGVLQNHKLYSSCYSTSDGLQGFLQHLRCREERNQSSHSLHPGLADSGFTYHQQVRGTDIVYPPLLSSRLERHSLLSHPSRRSYSISMATLLYLLPFSEPFPALIYPLEMRGTAHGNQSLCES